MECHLDKLWDPVRKRRYAHCDLLNLHHGGTWVDVGVCRKVVLITLAHMQ